MRSFLTNGAEGGTRTPTVLRPSAPQAGASANSATSAQELTGIGVVVAVPTAIIPDGFNTRSEKLYGSSTLFRVLHGKMELTTVRESVFE